MLPYIFILVGIIFLAIYLKTFFTAKPTPQKTIKTQQIKQKIIEKVNYGRVRIFYASQTGTAAKLAQQLGEQAAEQGFQPQVVDIKDVDIAHFQAVNQISVFLASNTGEGDPPEGCVKWMKVLRGKQQLHQVKVVPWKGINYTVFGLGNTQYEHYNVTGINIDDLLNKNGANRVYKLGLGDDNCSLQDDFVAWRKDLWPTLKQFRTSNPLKGKEHPSLLLRKQSSEVNVKYLSQTEPIYANFKIFFKRDSEEDYEWKEEDLDFKTKASLKADITKVKSIRQLRQNQNDGSTLQIQVELPNQNDYPTAGNIALYSKNQHKIIKSVIDYFQIKQTDLDRKIGITKINLDKKLKINFIPNTLRTLLEESIDIQGKLSKSVLKKLSKFQSDNPNYFTENSLKTTDQFRRITQRQDESEWYYLIRIIQQHHVKLTFQDFVELSDSIAPRLFTIASHARTQKNVIVAASIVKNGLISKYFLSKPEFFKAELKKSTFTDINRWSKVIFIAAGTGFAPFRGYLQQKQYNTLQKKEGKDLKLPAISLFFGCKHQNGDFIYKDEILQWRNKGVLDKLYLAFSRDTQKKIYVQDLLKQNQEELEQLSKSQETAIYICGSLAMGQSIVGVLTESLGAQRVKQMEEKGRIVKQLW